MGGGGQGVCYASCEYSLVKDWWDMRGVSGEQCEMISFLVFWHPKT